MGNILRLVQIVLEIISKIAFRKKKEFETKEVKED